MKARALMSATIGAALELWLPAAHAQTAAQSTDTQPTAPITLAVGPDQFAQQTTPTSPDQPVVAPSVGTDSTQPLAIDTIQTGTRQLGRTKQDSPAPIDVITAAQLAATGQQNVFDALNTLLPSFDLPQQGFDTAGLVRSARLRGLSPDDTLVLIDGKRRHVSANINADIGPVGGSDPVDFDMIPISLVDHIEVLRDGAAAQYGSDAIAGVVNIILKHADHGGAAYAQEGATYVQDGFTNNIGGNWSTSLFGHGFFDVAADYRYHDHTARDGTYPSEAVTGTDLAIPFNVPNKTGVSQIEGDPRYNLANVGYNMAYNLLPDVTFYSFATYGYRHAEAFENYRDPNTSGTYQPTAITPSTPFGNLTAFGLYPNGFEPLEASNEDDYAGTIGVKGAVGDWSYDLSETYGGDVVNLSTIASINTDFLHTFGYSPTSFHAGEYNDAESTANLDITRSVDVPVLPTPLNIAFGGEFRHDAYQLNPGDFASQFGGGSQAYPGFTNVDAGYYHRNNESGYIDLATHLLPHWQVDVAGRFEHYSDVGDTETGKFTTRYDFTSWFALRGTISNGFRAPTLAQEGFAAVNVAPTNASGQFPVDSAAARALGSIPLKPERSQNYEVGLVTKPLDRMNIAVDLYQIDIRDQIVDSGLISGPNALEAFALSGALPPTCTSPNSGCDLFAQFFTNGVNTKTRGVDITVDYLTNLGPDSNIAWLAAANFNDVELTRVRASAQFTPDVLSEITTDTPKNKIILQAIYKTGPLSVLGRVTRYGTATEVLTDGDSGGAPFTANRNRPAYIGDVAISYDILPGVTLTVGANNFTDKYAAHTTALSRYHNADEYIPSSPFGLDGGFYYARVNLAFGARRAPPPVPAELSVPVPAAAPLRTYLVFFDWDRADLTDRARQIVNEAAQAVSRVQTTRIEVNGYTDLSGTKPYNQRLSLRRAEAVQSELQRDGVPASEIAIHGYGETRPLVPTAPGAREPQNRRVEIILT